LRLKNENVLRSLSASNFKVRQYKLVSYAVGAALAGRGSWRLMLGLSVGSEPLCLIGIARHVIGCHPTQKKQRFNIVG
jgi:hypothetical protein